MAKQEAEELTGTVAAITWRSEDGTFLVARLNDGTTVTGQTAACPKLAAGSPYRFWGRWRQHQRHGRQFAFDAYTPIAPHDERGVLAYLEAFADGVGPKRSLQLWQAFGPDAVNVVAEHPERAVEAGILTRSQAENASQSLLDASAWQDTKIALMGMLGSRGFQLALVMREAISLWRGNAPVVIRRNPYSLMLRRVPSCGFTRCDKLYLDLGNNPARLKRQAIWIWHHLRNESQGHTWLKADAVGNALTTAIESGANPLRAMRLAKRARLIAVRHEADTWVADARKAENEAQLARHIRGLLTWTPPKKDSVKTSPISSETETMMDGL